MESRLGTKFNSQLKSPHNGLNKQYGAVQAQVNVVRSRQDELERRMKAQSQDLADLMARMALAATTSQFTLVPDEERLQ